LINRYHRHFIMIYLSDHRQLHLNTVLEIRVLVVLVLRNTVIMFCKNQTVSANEYL